MRKDAKKNRSITRWLLIAGVLTGLFFSSGEGIQLLPFPSVTAAIEKNNSRFHSGNSKSYSFSLHNSAAHKAIVKSKAQKNHKNFDCPEMFGHEFQTAELFYPAVGQTEFSATLFKTSGLTAFPSDRAPPAN